MKKYHGKEWYIMEKNIEKKKNIEKNLLIMEKNIEKRMCVYTYVCMYMYN